MKIKQYLWKRRIEMSLWIPYKDRKPPELKDVLTVTNTGEITIGYAYANGE